MISYGFSKTLSIGAPEYVEEEEEEESWVVFFIIDPWLQKMSSSLVR